MIEILHPSSVAAFGGSPRLPRSTGAEITTPGAGASTGPHLSLRLCKCESQLAKKSFAFASISTSEVVLQSLDTEGLHDGLCWLCRNFGHLAEDQPGPCLGGGLHPRLDHDKPWDCELALLHLCPGNVHEGIQHLRTLRLLLASCRCKCICDPALWQSLHTLCLHDL